MKKLRTLYLTWDKGITIAGANELVAFKNLETLGLAGTNATNEWMVPLGKLKHLQELNVNATKVDHVGVRRLQQMLPDCKIEE